ncbi:MAG: DUF1848 domain-containing protein [Terracidiphilus sp.]
MIISASYKTDIPAFYGKWFMNRLRDGYCRVRNPYNGKMSLISLRRENVDGFVFWTKNAGPFLPHLPEVKRLGFPFYVQYTINGYPRQLEFSVTDKQRSIKHAKEISSAFGSAALVWRYDTILITTLTPPGFHIRNFKEIAEKLQGVTSEVVVSFAQIYAKTKRNLNEAAKEASFEWIDPPPKEKFALCLELTGIARRFGMQLSVCSQHDYVVPGAIDAQCVDKQRLAELAGRPIAAPLKGNRPECGCYESRDIGDYDTCPHGCVYCYAVMNRRLAQERYREHDPESDCLHKTSAEAEEPAEPPAQGTLPMF